MKKLGVSVLAAVMLAGSFGVVADASTTDVSKLRDQLVSLGVPSNDANQLITYLQSIDLSSSDEADLDALVQDAYALIGDRTDLTALSSTEKTSLMDTAKQAANKVGLVLNYDITNGVDTVTLVSTNGQPVLSLTAPDIADVLQNFDGDMTSVINTILETTVEAVIGTNKPGNESVTPMPDTELEGTGAQLPVMVLSGAGLVALAGALMVVSKHQMQE